MPFLERDLKKHLPPYSSLGIQYYLWPEGSNISTHDDRGDRLAGATIYLNPEWHPDMGGLFVWTDGESQELKVLCPRMNMMVINDKYEDHLVTPITSACKEMRATVQIWVYE